MPDPFTIVGLAAAIAQFLDIGFRLVSDAHEIYESHHGTKQEFVELRLVAEDIKNLNEEITSNLPHQPLVSKDDIAINTLARQCDTLADSLLSKLMPLEARDDTKSRFLESARVSILIAMRRKEILAIHQRLRLIESQLRERVTRAVQKDQWSSILLVLDSIRRENAYAQSEAASQLARLEKAIHSASLVHEGDDGEYNIPLKELYASLHALLQEGRAVDHRQSVIQSLTFKTMKRRHGQIDVAHYKTLEWVWDSSQTTLSRWLEEDNGIYWINGQAGSGKSTLMKYISDHERSRDLLQVWAGDHRLFIASFYFWNSGVDMQKSQIGLLQSIMYQILRVEPSLVAHICPDHEVAEPWDIPELRKALSGLVDAAPSAKFCFFIDGLDEYDGSEFQIINVLKDLARMENIKICTSSRPWIAFEKELSRQDHMFVLQNFTRRDMENYIQSILVENDQFKYMTHIDPRCNTLASEIAQRSNGVWLWVFLVVRDLMRDINTGETYDTLEARLNSLPRELNEYFSRILGRIDPFFQKDTARIFLMAVDSAKPFPLFGLSFLRHEAESITHAIEAVVKPVTPHELLEVCRNWRLQLQNRCGDLLIVQTCDTEDVLNRQTVDFLHRTVRDFLRDNHHTALHYHAPKGFDAKKTLCRMILTMLKTYPIRNFRQDANGLFGLVDEFLYYAYELEQLGQAESQFPLLDELDRVMGVHAKEEHSHWTNGRDSPTNVRSVEWIERGQCSFLALAVQARLQSYVQHVLNKDPTRLHKKGRPLLDYALRPTRVTPAELPYYHEREIAGIETGLVVMLLSRGADPNEPIHIYADQTPWELFVLFFCEKYKQPPDEDNPYFEVAHLLAEHGANLNHVVRFHPIRTHMGTTARYKTEVTVEKNQAPARNILRSKFTANQMRDLDNSMQEARARAQSTNPGWLEWIGQMVTRAVG